MALWTENPVPARENEEIPVGEVTIQFEVEKGRIREAAVYSDALKTGLIERCQNI